MTAYTGPDEYPIKEIPATAWWSENFAAMFASPAEKVAVFYSLGRWHGDPTLWRELIIISLPDKRVIFSKGYGRNGSLTGAGGALSHYEIVEPGKKVRLNFDGPMSESTLDEMVADGQRSGPAKRCKLDLRFDAAAPMWNMKGDSAEAASVAGSIHIDHIGKANGSIEYDGKTYHFKDGYSSRDHSRGAREVSAYGAHNWINCLFPSGRAIYLYAMKSHGSTAIGMSNAAVAQGDRLYPAKLLHTEFITSSADVGKCHKIILDCELGQMALEIAEVANSLPSHMVVPFETNAGAAPYRPSAFIVDESVLMKWNGEQAWGWSERGIASQSLVP